MYRRVLMVLTDALRSERPDLLDLLVKKVLPVLVAVRDPLTVEELEWAVGGGGTALEQVAQLVRLLANLFPLRTVGASGEERLTPYHKSVLDWLLGTGEMDPHDFKVDALVGHELLATACAARIASAPQQGVPAPAPASAAVGRSYALRHAVAHACQSGVPALVEQLLTNFQGLWGDVHEAGAPVLLNDSESGIQI